MEVCNGFRRLGMFGDVRLYTAPALCSHLVGRKGGCVCVCVCGYWFKILTMLGITAITCYDTDTK